MGKSGLLRTFIATDITLNRHCIMLWLLHYYMETFTSISVTKIADVEVESSCVSLEQSVYNIHILHLCRRHATVQCTCYISQKMIISVDIGCYLLVNPRPAGPLDFPPPAGGAVVETPSISAPGPRSDTR